MSFFKSIKGGKYDFITDPIVKGKIDEAGRKNIIFVEGRDDERIFSILFPDYIEEKLSFIGVGGHQIVKQFLDQIIQKEIKGVFGIIDRDFQSEDERSDLLETYNGILYVLERCTIENYLIESTVLLELLKDKLGGTVTVTTDMIDDLIFEIFNELIPIMSANRVLFNFSIEKLNTSCRLEEDIIKRNLLDLLLKNNASFDEREVLELYELFKRELTSTEINELQKFINGKYFLHNFRHLIKNRYGISGLKDDLMTKSHLARIIFSKDIRFELHEYVEKMAG